MQFVCCLGRLAGSPLTVACRRSLFCALLSLLVCVQTSLAAEELGLDETRWAFRVDMGGTIPKDAKLTRFVDPVSNQELKLSPGFQMDMALDYKITPWLSVGGELGFLFNGVDAFGNFSYPDTSLFQMPIMANLTLRYPARGRFVPYIGAGVGGVASFLSFGEDYYWGPDGIGSDFTLGAQAFAGLNYRLNEKSELGVMYRFLYTGSQDWNVEWWDGGSFHVSVDSIQVHTICLVFSFNF